MHRRPFEVPLLLLTVTSAGCVRSGKRTDRYRYELAMRVLSREGNQQVLPFATSPCGQHDMKKGASMGSLFRCVLSDSTRLNRRPKRTGSRSFCGRRSTCGCRVRRGLRRRRSPHLPWPYPSAHHSGKSGVRPTVLGSGCNRRFLPSALRKGPRGIRPMPPAPL